MNNVLKDSAGWNNREWDLSGALLGGRNKFGASRRISIARLLAEALTLALVKIVERYLCVASSLC